MIQDCQGAPVALILSVETPRTVFTTTQDRQDATVRLTRGVDALTMVFGTIQDVRTVVPHQRGNSLS
eukprot:5289028-Pyramimonas_sp.AAC.1